MKTSILFIILVSAFTVTFAQATKKTVELPEFKSIYVNSNYTVSLKQTNKQEVTVEALPDIYDVTNIYVDNGILMINVEKKPDNQNKSVWAKIDDIKIRPTMKVYVSVKNIDQLQVNGGGKIVSDNSLAASDLKLLVSGSGSMDLDIKGDVVQADVTGSGSLALRGYATSAAVNVSGSGSFNAFNCPIERATVTVSGSGTCELNVSADLNATVTGSGTIKHKGNTKTVQKKVYGTGSVDRAY